MHARFVIVAVAALAFGSGCEASSRAKSEAEGSLRQEIVTSLAPKKVECSLEHDKMRPDKLRVRCQSPEMGHVPLANGVKDVLAKHCSALKQADFSKVEIDVPRESGGNHTVWGNVGDDCDDWMSLTGLF